jgi:hypothetical protein
MNSTIIISVEVVEELKQHNESSDTKKESTRYTTA